jgi:hypothetical protein
MYISDKPTTERHNPISAVPARGHPTPGYLGGTAVASRIRHLNCSASDLTAIEAVVGRTVTGNELRQAVENAAEQASTWIANTQRALTASPRTEQTRQLFFESFAADPEFVPRWRPTNASWADLGELVALRMRRAKEILDGGQIRYSCWHSATNCPECAGSSPHNIFACSSFRGQYRICFGAPFWRSYRDGDVSRLASNLLHEALHIYFGTTVAHSGSTGNAQCYQRLMLRLNSIRVHALTVMRCPPNLRKGSRGGDVREAQLRLNRWITTSGAKFSQLKVDGIFGSLTAAVVREFQRRQGLDMDGVIGPRSWAALPTILPLQNGSRGLAVKELQRRLNFWMESRRSASLAKLTTDGIFGKNTEAAVRAAQGAEGLTVNGAVNSLTWSHLPTD